MNEKRKFLTLFIDQMELFDSMSDEEIGKVMRAVKIYFENGEDKHADGLHELLNDRVVNMAFTALKISFTRANSYIDRRSETSSENGKKGGRPKKNALPPVAEKVEVKDKEEEVCEKPKKPNENLTEPKKAIEYNIIEYNIIDNNNSLSHTREAEVSKVEVKSSTPDDEVKKSNREKIAKVVGEGSLGQWIEMQQRRKGLTESQLVELMPPYEDFILEKGYTGLGSIGIRATFDKFYENHKFELNKQKHGTHFEVRGGGGERRKRGAAVEPGCGLKRRD